MRKRAAALLTTGIAVVAISGIAAPAQATVDWTYIGEYRTKSQCIDAGQQYQREGWNEYTCRTNPQGTWYLFIQ